jgi:hypothetical protein
MNMFALESGSWKWLKGNPVQNWSYSRSCEFKKNGDAILSTEAIWEGCITKNKPEDLPD